MATAISEWVGKLGDSDPAVAFSACRQIEQAAAQAGAEGREPMDAVADALAEELTAMTPEGEDDQGRRVAPKPVHSVATRNAICRLMGFVAGSKQVPALAGAIKDLDVREMARWSLDRNCSDEATDALIAALDEVGPTFRIGVVGALRTRKSDKAAAALRRVALEDAIAEVRISAVESLAEYTDGDSAAVVMRTTLSTEPGHAVRAYRAAVRLAENFAKAGKTSEAAGLYRMVVSGAGVPDAQKQAALKAHEKLM